MLEQRVAALERDRRQIEAKIDRIDAAARAPGARYPRHWNGCAQTTWRFGRFAIATVEGQLRGLPTFLQLVVALITTWAAGAAIVLALIKASHP